VSACASYAARDTCPSSSPRLRFMASMFLCCRKGERSTAAPAAPTCCAPSAPSDTGLNLVGLGQGKTLARLKGLADSSIIIFVLLFFCELLAHL
jgi:hypothetical protein